MTDSMNFGPEWLRNLSSEGSTGGGTSGGTRYQLAEFRYGREEMLTLFERGSRPPTSLISFPSLYSEPVLPPLALTPQADDERAWPNRSVPPGGTVRGRGSSLERGGRASRGGRGLYQSYGRTTFDSSGGWGNGEPSDWSPRKDYGRASSMDNWRRNRTGEDDEGWRNAGHNRPPFDKFGRSSSWRDGGEGADDRGPGERGNRAWQDNNSRGPPQRRPWNAEDHLPEWATENPSESGGTFDATGAFHGSDDEQRDQPPKKETPLQKSVSQQNISSKPQHPPPLPTSQSAISLVKPPPDEEEENKMPEIQRVKQELKSKTATRSVKQQPKETPCLEERIEHPSDKPPESRKRLNNNNNGGEMNGMQSGDSSNGVDEDFERLQEDLVKKLVVDEELPKKTMDNFCIPNVPVVTNPPPNLGAPVQDKWYYQDPQGNLQGPFLSFEMSEWFKAGYFSMSLLVKRQCDDGFFTLGELVTLCSGNPFQSATRIAPLKQDIPVNPEGELLQFQMLQRQMAMTLRQASAMRSAHMGHAEPWTAAQREMMTQPVLPPGALASDLQFLQQPPPLPNPLMHMISQMQQANKLPTPTIPDKPSAPVAQQLDPIQTLMQQMGGLQSIPANHPLTNPPIPSLNTPNPLTAHLPGTGMLNSFPNIPPIPNLAGMGPGPGGIAPEGVLPPRPNPLGAVDPLSTGNENDPIKSLLRQLQNKQPPAQMDSLWQQNQFNAPPQPKPQWQQNEPNPMCMWDIQPPTTTPTNVSCPEPPKEERQSSQPPQQIEQPLDKSSGVKTKENKDKKKREQEEKEKRREVEEKRKEEQRRQEAEKKAAEEKRKKEEDRIRKELEKAKRDAEEKRLKELEEKRRLKEQRKCEEEARKRAEEKKAEDLERMKKEMKEREEHAKKQADIARQEGLRMAKAAPWLQPAATAPWLQSASAAGESLEEIQKAEKKEKHQQLQQQQRQVVVQEPPPEKPAPIYTWAKKPPEPRHIPSVHEIQEQERLAKQAAEARLAQLKEKEAPVQAPTTYSTPWSGQTGLSWANTASQWNNAAGFWEESSVMKTNNKPSPVLKSVSTSAITSKNHQLPPQQQQQQQIKSAKNKTKKEEEHIKKLFNNGPAADEFTDWCYQTLMQLDSSVDVPTFVVFLRDIESALEVREYCKEYLGDSTATQTFASQFLERRRKIKPKNVSQKDDMSSPAPAINPTQHMEFQEVKGKAKKPKKSKMTKVDARILGFSVTAAPDRLNVGDRDYVDN